MGRVKLKIKKLENTNGRQATFAKRKHGIMKKANELSILCDIDVVLLMFSPSGKPSLCSRKHSLEEVITKLAQLTPQERAKRKLESLEALKKTFMKLDHDVNISEFFGRSKSTYEEVTNRAKMLQMQLSEVHTRLSYWTEPEKIDSIDDLGQMENALRQSLDQVRAHKENMQQQQQQLIHLDGKNEIQSEMPLSFGMDSEQQFQPLSWVHNDGSMNISLQEDPSLLHHREMACSASSSLGNYSGLFGTSKSPDLSNSGIENCVGSEFTGSCTDPNNLMMNSNNQYPSMAYNLSFLNDPKLQQLAEWNLLGSPADYYVSQILEASRPQFNMDSGNWASSASVIPCSVSGYDDPLFSRQPN
ncbi:PREDICTED: agamous-like MADS-box protein AGL30 isoform X2 [Tarenaya hassleriana]|nr:PREDICTED: agamous-like MADS-box protein AGL30 isoform X2 [Tarenaya hassleriana]